MPLDEIRPSKGPEAGTMMDAVGRENGIPAVHHPPIVALAAIPVADRRIRAGFEGSEEEEVLKSTNSARMGGKSPISTIIV